MTPTIITVCAWCAPTREQAELRAREARGEVVISHGICRRCAARVLAEQVPVATGGGVRR